MKNNKHISTVITQIFMLSVFLISMFVTNVQSTSLPNDSLGVFFTHKADTSNIVSNFTIIDHPLINNNPNAIVMITQNWNPEGVGGTYNDHSIGVWYSSNINKWAIFNQDKVEMTENAAFNILIPNTETIFFAHKADTSNIVSNFTNIDHPLTNNNPNAIVMITQNWNPEGIGGTYNDHSIGVWYNSSINKWSIFNQDGVEMMENAAFNILVLGSLPTSIAEERKTTPSGFNLVPNYPNPFNPTTTITYSIPRVTTGFNQVKVELNIYDILGREVAILVNEVKSAGTYDVKFNASSLTSGIYFYRLRANGFMETKKMMLMK